MPETHDTPEIELWFGQKVRYRNGHALYAPLRLRIPSLFWHAQNYPEGVVEVDGRPKQPPIVERARSVESDEPYRVGRGVALRLWPTRHAVVVGVWVHRGTLPAESEVLAEQLGGQMVDAETMERLGPIADWAGPDETTDDSDVQPDTVMVYDDAGAPVMREGSTKPFSDEQHAVPAVVDTGLALPVWDDPEGEPRPGSMD